MVRLHFAVEVVDTSVGCRKRECLGIFVSDTSSVDPRRIRRRVLFHVAKSSGGLAAAAVGSQQEEANSHRLGNGGEGRERQWTASEVRRGVWVDRRIGWIARFVPVV